MLQYFRLVGLALLLSVGIGSVANAQFVQLKEVQFWQYERGFFSNSWSRRQVDGATYNGQFVPLTQISKDLIKRKINSWCTVYLQDMAPVSLYYIEDGEAVIYRHDSEDFLKFKC